ncbi:MAG TPA: hypothetical protein VK000_11175 [Luteimonas sp.]|nr:hypothetical protein [Luteimonas sp.]
MTRTRIPRSPKSRLTACLLAVLLAPAALAGEPANDSIGREISQEMTEARREVREELAVARAELETENLVVGDSLRFSRSKDDEPALPKAEITARGDFLIDGEAVAIDAAQRRELLAYRGQVIDIAMAGIDIGERSANAALDMVDQGLFRLMFSAMTGRLERRMDKAVRQAVEPGVRGICRRLPTLLEAQQRLAAAVPEFRPYATMEAGDLDRCMDEVRREFARR